VRWAWSSMLRFAASDRIVITTILSGLQRRRYVIVTIEPACPMKSRRTRRQNARNALAHRRVGGARLATSWIVKLQQGAAVAKTQTLVERIRGEFIEMPGLQLTMPQAARLWGLDIAACRHVIEVLVESAFLRWTPAGTVVRAN
jgi:hypothetical protein